MEHYISSVTVCGFGDIRDKSKLLLLTYPIVMLTSWENLFSLSSIQDPYSVLYNVRVLSVCSQGSEINHVKPWLFPNFSLTFHNKFNQAGVENDEPDHLRKSLLIQK